MEKIIKEAKEAQKRLEALYKRQEIAKKAFEDLSWKLEIARREEVDVIDEKYRTKKLEFERVSNKEQETIKNEMSSLQKTVEAIDKIFKIKKVVEMPESEKQLTIELKNFDGRDNYLEFLGSNHNPPYLTAKFYIKETKKPTNKYALVMVGSSIFHNADVIKFPRDFGATASYNVICGENRNYESVAMILKEAPSVSALKEWFGKKSNNTDALWDEEILAKFNQLVKDYEWVKENCNTPEWEKAYLEWQREYYEKNWSNYEEEKEYKDICKKLKKMEVA